MNIGMTLKRRIIETKDAYELIQLLSIQQTSVANKGNELNLLLNLMWERCREEQGLSTNDPVIKNLTEQIITSSALLGQRANDLFFGLKGRFDENTTDKAKQTTSTDTAKIQGENKTEQNGD